LFYENGEMMASGSSGQGSGGLFADLASGFVAMDIPGAGRGEEAASRRRVAVLVEAEARDRSMGRLPCLVVLAAACGFLSEPFANAALSGAGLSAHCHCLWAAVR
jgi:hypothetical protein